MAAKVGHLFDSCSKYKTMCIYIVHIFVCQCVYDCGYGLVLANACRITDGLIGFSTLGKFKI